MDYDVGTITGAYDGREVCANMTSSGLNTTHMKLHGPLLGKFELSTGRSRRRQKVPKTGSRGFDRLFKTRDMSPDVVAAIASGAAELEVLGEVQRRWRWKLGYLLVSGGAEPKLRCRLYDFQMYTEARVLRRLLRDLSEVAKALESVLQS